jgi:hypothetical protein
MHKIGTKMPKFVNEKENFILKICPVYDILATSGRISSAEILR